MFVARSWYLLLFDWQNPRGTTIFQQSEYDGRAFWTGMDWIRTHFCGRGRTRSSNFGLLNSSEIIHGNTFTPSLFGHAKSRSQQYDTCGGVFENSLWPLQDGPLTLERNGYREISPRQTQ